MKKSSEASARLGIALDAAELWRRGVLAPGSRKRWVLTWTDALGRAVASVAYEAEVTDAARVAPAALLYALCRRRAPAGRPAARPTC